MHHPTDRIAHTTAFVTPVVEHWQEREIAQSKFLMIIIIIKMMIIIMMIKYVLTVFQRCNLQISIKKAIMIFLWLCHSQRYDF